MAAKRTSELIPLCHPIALTDVGVEITPDRAVGALRIRATAATIGADGRGDGGPHRGVRGGADRLRHGQGRGPQGGDPLVRLLEKSGGKSGEWHRPDASAARQPRRPARPHGRPRSAAAWLMGRRGPRRGGGAQAVESPALRADGQRRGRGGCPRRRERRARWRPAWRAGCEVDRAVVPDEPDHVAWRPSAAVGARSRAWSSDAPAAPVSGPRDRTPQALAPCSTSRSRASAR